VVDDAARADGPHDVGFSDTHAALHSDRAEMNERRGVAERSLDRDRLAADRNGARERDDAVGRSTYVGARRRAQVETAVLPGRVRMRAVERERTENRPVDRPRPSLRRGHGKDERTEREDGDSPKHVDLLVASFAN